MKTLLSILALTLATLGFAGNGSGAGGGPVVFQAELMREILNTSSFIMSFNATAKNSIRSIEILHAAQGVSTYRVTSNGGCDVRIVTDCATALNASDCKLTFDQWQCP